MKALGYLKHVFMNSFHIRLSTFTNKRKQKLILNQEMIYSVYQDRLPRIYGKTKKAEKI